MRRDDEYKRLFRELHEFVEEIKREHGGASDRRIKVDKRTHRIRFEGETEDEVTIVIEERKSGRIADDTTKFTQ